MDIHQKNLFCKDCARECIILRSPSSKNPNRSYYSCPIPRENGGHGWIKWVEYDGSSQSRSTSAIDVDLADLARSQVALAEARIKFLEDKLKAERVKNKFLNDQMKEELMKTRCLKKILKGTI